MNAPVSRLRGIVRTAGSKGNGQEWRAGVDVVSVQLFSEIWHATATLLSRNKNCTFTLIKKNQSAHNNPNYQSLLCLNTDGVWSNTALQSLGA